MGKNSEIARTDLPILPDEWRLAVAKDKKTQFAVLKKLLNRKDVEYVVNGCDAGREGELIFGRVYQLSGSRLPIKRIWISSMEDSAIREAFSCLKDAQNTEPLRSVGLPCESGLAHWDERYQGLYHEIF